MKRVKGLSSFFCLAMSLIIAGCGNPFGGKSSEVDLDHEPGFSATNEIAPSRGSEFVAASSRGALTSGGRFKIDATLASPASGVALVTPNRKYRLFSNVQGEMVSASTCVDGANGSTCR